MKTYSVGMSTCGEVIAPEDFFKYAEAGVEKMELSFPSGTYEGMDWSALKCGADGMGIEIYSIHLPFSQQFNPAQLDNAVRCAAVERFQKIIEASQVTDAKVYVIHASSEPIFDCERMQAMRNARESLAAIADFALRRGVRIAVENLPRTCLGKNSEEILELISVHENLYVCFDTNHLLEEDSLSFIKSIGDKMITTHISDYDFTDERHWLPGEGKINWPEMMGALDAVGYAGPLMYELKFLAKNKRRLRPLEPADFVKNAEELMKRRPLTKIE